jgi:hypothetical protein
MSKTPAAAAWEAPAQEGVSSNVTPQPTTTLTAPQPHRNAEVDAMIATVHAELDQDAANCALSASFCERVVRLARDTKVDESNRRATSKALLRIVDEMREPTTTTAAARRSVLAALRAVSSRMGFPNEVLQTLSPHASGLMRLFSAAPRDDGAPDVAAVLNTLFLALIAPPASGPKPNATFATHFHKAPNGSLELAIVTHHHGTRAQGGTGVPTMSTLVAAQDAATFFTALLRADFSNAHEEFIMNAAFLLDCQTVECLAANHLFTDAIEAEINSGRHNARSVLAELRIMCKASGLHAPAQAALQRYLAAAFGKKIYATLLSLLVAATMRPAEDASDAATTAAAAAPVGVVNPVFAVLTAIASDCVACFTPGFLTWWPSTIARLLESNSLDFQERHSVFWFLLTALDHRDGARSLRNLSGVASYQIFACVTHSIMTRQDLALTSDASKQAALRVLGMSVVLETLRCIGARDLRWFTDDGLLSKYLSIAAKDALAKGKFPEAAQSQLRKLWVETVHFIIDTPDTVCIHRVVTHELLLLIGMYATVSATQPDLRHDLTGVICGLRDIVSTHMTNTFIIMARAETGGDVVTPQAAVQNTAAIVEALCGGPTPLVFSLIVPLISPTKDAPPSVSAKNDTTSSDDVLTCRHVVLDAAVTLLNCLASPDIIAKLTTHQVLHDAIVQLLTQPCATAVDETMRQSGRRNLAKLVRLVSGAIEFAQKRPMRRSSATNVFAGSESVTEQLLSATWDAPVFVHALAGVLEYRDSRQLTLSPEEVRRVTACLATMPIDSVGNSLPPAVKRRGPRRVVATAVTALRIVDVEFIHPLGSVRYITEQLAKSGCFDAQCFGILLEAFLHGKHVLSASVVLLARHVAMAALFDDPLAITAEFADAFKKATETEKTPTSAETPVTVKSISEAVTGCLAAMQRSGGATVSPVTCEILLRSAAHGSLEPGPPAEVIAEAWVCGPSQGYNKRQIHYKPMLVERMREAQASAVNTRRTQAVAYVHARAFRSEVATTAVTDLGSEPSTPRTAAGDSVAPEWVPRDGCTLQSFAPEPMDLIGRPSFIFAKSLWISTGDKTAKVTRLNETSGDEVPQ